MIAGVGFKKQLWALDPELDVVWSAQKGRWEIWRFPGQVKMKKKKWDTESHHVMTVQTSTGDFRELGSDVLLNLQKGDTSKFSLTQLVDYFDQMDKNIRREKEKELLNKIGSFNSDFLNYSGGYSVPVSSKYEIINVSKETRVKSLLGG